MADVTPTPSPVPPRRDTVIFWETLTNTNTAGASVHVGGAVADMIVTFTGTPNGATAVLQGSVDNTTWFTVKDVDGTDVSTTLAASAFFEVRSKFAYFRPSTSGGGASQDIDCKLQISRSQNL